MFLQGVGYEDADLVLFGKVKCLTVVNTALSLRAS